MFGRHPGNPRHEPGAAVAPWVADQSVPARACCCPGRPVAKVIMPPAPGRPHPVDLWLCGHHYRSSFVALAAAGARVYDLTVPDTVADPGRLAAVTR